MLDQIDQAPSCPPRRTPTTPHWSGQAATVGKAAEAGPLGRGKENQGSEVAAQDTVAQEEPVKEVKPDHTIATSKWIVTPEGPRDDTMHKSTDHIHT